MGRGQGRRRHWQRRRLQRRPIASGGRRQAERVAAPEEGVPRRVRGPLQDGAARSPILPAGFPVFSRQITFRRQISRRWSVCTGARALPCAETRRTDVHARPAYKTALRTCPSLGSWRIADKERKRERGRERERNRFLALSRQISFRISRRWSVRTGARALPCAETRQNPCAQTRRPCLC